MSRCGDNSMSEVRNNNYLCPICGTLTSNGEDCKYCNGIPKSERDAEYE